jgi:hypothetical protein
MTTGEQRLAALARANEVQRARGQRLQRLDESYLRPREATRRAIEILEENDPSIRSMTVGRLVMERLRSRTSSKVKARWLILAQCSETKRVGDLTERQRSVLLAAMRDYAESRP